MQETWVLSLGQEDPLEKGLATHFSILAWRIPWAEEPGGPQSVGLQRIGHNLVTEQQSEQRVSLVAQIVKNPPNAEDVVSLLGWDGSLEKEMTAHSSILAWRVPWTEELVDYSLWGPTELNTTE